MLWRNIQTTVRFFGTYFLDYSMDSLNLKLGIDFSEKHSDFFQRIFLISDFDMVEKQRSINLSSCRSYVSVVLGDSDVTFLRETGDAAFCPFLYCILFIDNIE